MPGKREFNPICSDDQKFEEVNMDYWEECISEACDDAGLKATDEQISIIASWVEGAHENYGMAHGYDAIPNHLQLENEKLEKELKREKDKIPCPECGTRGRIVMQGPYHSSDSECYKCRGNGFLYRD